ncbi:MAG: type III ribulose-bisphosphate carboxylase, partial [Candidatus Diapherotrites archaeon]|nr:type III ribulose-bisphosphate carboxylase [Candidatus Diapherotrites archaeon]
PYDLWEPSNMPQLLSGIAGNIFGMKAVKNLRLVDFSVPTKYLKSFKGPKYGINGVRKFMKVKKRPLTATVPKPKIGFSAKEHSDLAYDLWTGGIDLVKDDENLTSTKFNKFDDRIKTMSRLRDKAEKVTGERKSALLNISGPVELMKKRAKQVADLGWEYVMIDVVTTGPAAVETMRDYTGDLGLAIHAHRAMHAAFTRNQKHGLSMQALAKIERMLGVDQLHLGTKVGKLVSPEFEVLAIQHNLVDKVTPDSEHNIKQDWSNVKPVFPVTSGGLHPGLVPDVMKLFGPNIVIQAGGGTLGHPQGATKGATALRQAIDATLNGFTLKEYAKTHSELEIALKKWGHISPR